MYHVIMVPVDGSAFSRDAVFQGLRLARKNNAQLRLVRVGPMPFVFGPETVQLETKAWKAQREALLEEMYQLAAECRTGNDVDVTVSVEDGPIAEALRAHATRHDVDLIVMASHTRRGLARVWLGSVSDRLIRETGIPVLVVRPPSLATELGSGPCFKRIVIALDGSVLAEGALRPALALAEAEDAEVTLLRIVPENSNIPEGEMVAAIGPARARDVQDAQWYLASIRILLTQRRIRTRSKIVVASDVPRAILDFAQSRNADVIAIATHGRGGIKRAMIGSVADNILSDGVISVLAIHPEEAMHTTSVARPMFAEATV